MRERLQRTENILAAAEAAALAALLAVMICLAFAQVVLRQCGAGLLWGETALKHLVLWTGLLGAALAAHGERHFSWEASHLNVSARLRPWLRLVSSTAAAAVTALLLRAAWTYLAAERDAATILMTIGSVDIPSWAAAAGIPGGLALVLAHLLFKAADAAAEAANR